MISNDNIGVGGKEEFVIKSRNKEFSEDETMEKIIKNKYFIGEIDKMTEDKEKLKKLKTQLKKHQKKLKELKEQEKKLKELKKQEKKDKSKSFCDLIINLLLCK